MQTPLIFDNINQIGDVMAEYIVRKGKFSDEVSPAGSVASSQSSSASAPRLNKKIIYAVAALVSLSLILLAIF